MTGYLLRRFLEAVVTLIGVSIIVFLLARLSGDPVPLMLSQEASAEDVQSVRVALGLDKPLYVQYGYFVRGVVQGDLGTSIKSRKPVTELLRARLPNSMRLATAAIVITLLMGLPLGIVAALNKGKAIDTLATTVSVLGQSLPAFWLGIILIQLFALKVRWLPVMGIGGIDHYILPGFTLGFHVVAGVMRLLRSSMLEVLDSDFVKFARIKGVSEAKVIWKHALRNALVPVVSFSGLYFAILVTMAMVVEVVFAWPGLGRLAYEGIMARDFPVIQGVVLAGAALVMAVNFACDIVYAFVDPRIRYS